MLLPDYAFSLPEKLIATKPAHPRDHSRLLLVNRQTGALSHHHFYDLPQLLTPNDVLVFNQTKVIPARLFATKDTGGQVEILLLKQLDPSSWQVISRPGLRSQQIIHFSPHLHAQVTATNPDQTLDLTFTSTRKSPLTQQIFAHGHTPLPPYIKSHLPEEKLRSLYQTTYAKTPGSSAAPTAGLHFTPALLKKLRAQGIQTEFVTLHVGLGTFKPLTPENLKTGKLHTESFHLDPDTAARLNQAKQSGKRIIAVGTTTTRVLETCADDQGVLHPATSQTDIFIRPPYRFKFVSGLLTNFHLPNSSLLMLVSAFAASPQLVRSAYLTAITQKYRFYSFGDAMLLV